MTKYNPRPILFVILAVVLVLGVTVIVLLSPELSQHLPFNPFYPSPSQVKRDIPDWIQVFFTQPDPPDNLVNGIDRSILPYIDGAKQTIDVASFNLNLPSVVSALVRASQKGVRVRVVYDSNGDLEFSNRSVNLQPIRTLELLQKAKIQAVDGGRVSGLMHDKFIIIDRQVIFVGSWNISYNDTYRNNNNLLLITNQKIIDNYQSKFDEMVINKRFGANAKARTPVSSVKVDQVLVENYFAPEDRVMDHLIDQVEGAQRSIQFLIFTFTDHKLAETMVTTARQKGIPIAGVIEANGYDAGIMAQFACAGFPVKMDGNKYNMHHKVMILDGETVVTGSFNFTKSADTINDDNVLIIHNPAVAALFEQEFQKVYSVGTTPSPGEYRCNQ